MHNEGRISFHLKALGSFAFALDILSDFLDAREPRKHDFPYSLFRDNASYLYELSDYYAAMTDHTNLVRYEFVQLWYIGELCSTAHQ